MGFSSMLGLGNSSKKSIGSYKKWGHKGKLGLKSSLAKSSMSFSERKKIKSSLNDKFGSGKKLTHNEIVRHVGREFGLGAQRRIKKALMEKGQEGLSKEQIARNLRYNKQTDTSALEAMGGARRTKQDVLGTVGGGVKGSVSRLGVGAGTSKTSALKGSSRPGFASQNKPSNNIPSKGTSNLPSGGVGGGMGKLF